MESKSALAQRKTPKAGIDYPRNFASSNRLSDFT